MHGPYAHETDQGDASWDGVLLGSSETFPTPDGADEQAGGRVHLYHDATAQQGNQGCAPEKSNSLDY